jgi:hypothetical protein
MKTNATLLVLLFLFVFNSCKKEDNNSNNSEPDLTTDVLGVYTSGSSLVITVTKVDNSTISVNIKDINNNETHSSTKMQSKNAFTLNKVTVVGGVETYEYSGTGTYSTNTIDITRVEKQIETSTGIVADQWTEQYIGTK